MKYRLLASLIFALSVMAPPLLSAGGNGQALDPGTGLLSEMTATTDRLCGWIVSPVDGTRLFSTGVAGEKIWISRTLVNDYVPLQAGVLYAIVVQAPKSKHLTLMWLQQDGKMAPVPKAFLYPPTDTVVKGCTIPS